MKNGQATCILVLGSSLGESATLNYNPILVNNRKVIHIDWDFQELGKVFKTDVKINSDLKIALSDILEMVKEKDKKFKRELPLNNPYEKNHTGLSIRIFLEEIVKVLPKNTQYISDIGEFMNFVFKYLSIDEQSDFDMSLNYGAMGSGIGSSIGVSMAKPNSPVAVIVGDGSFLMNGMEIITAKEYNRPIIYFIINNAMLSYVEHGQKFIYGRTIPGFSQQRIELAQMTKSMGINSMKISSIEDIMKVKEFITDFDKPYVIELVTDGSERPAVADRFKALAKRNKI